MAEIRDCPTCGDQFAVTRRPPRDQKYCSRTCWDSRTTVEQPYFCKRKHGFTSNYRKNKCGSRTCKDCERELQALRYKADPESGRARSRRWRERDPEHARAVTRANVKSWREANPEKSKQIDKKYYEKNKDKFFLAVMKRQRLISEAAICDFTRGQWEKLKADYGFRCAYCNEPSAILEREHIVPVSRGGDHTLSNIVPACRPCNRSKGTQLITPQYMNMAFHQ